LQKIGYVWSRDWISFWAEIGYAQLNMFFHSPYLVAADVFPLMPERDAARYVF